MSRPDPIPDLLKQDPKAAQLLGDPAGLKALLSSPETQHLMALLNRSAGDGLSTAAQAAAQGKPQALLGILSQVMSSQEGSQAVEALKKNTEPRS